MDIIPSPMTSVGTRYKRIHDVHYEFGLFENALKYS